MPSLLSSDDFRVIILIDVRLYLIGVVLSWHSKRPDNLKEMNTTLEIHNAPKLETVESLNRPWTGKEVESGTKKDIKNKSPFPYIGNVFT